MQIFVEELINEWFKCLFYISSVWFVRVLFWPARATP